jgi:formylglycine-generating enzyme required for sulfatase activity
MVSNKIKWCILFSWLLVFSAPCSGHGADLYRDPVTGMEFVFLKGGCFQMGSENGTINERPVHTACVGDFFMGKYEVTQGQWKAVMGNNPAFFSRCGDDCPVESVSWTDVQEFLSRLHGKTGTNHYRLPTEAEWEYAARAGTQTRYSYGDDARDLGDHAWYDKNSTRSEAGTVYYHNKLIQASPHPVGQKKPNAFGLYDMHGNVREWVSDWYGDYRPGREQNPAGPSSGASRVHRGGTWDDGAGQCRSANRLSSHPLGADGDRGFRLLKTP